jgi:LysM repeat protein
MNPMAHSTRRFVLPPMAALGLVAVLALAACGGAADQEPAAGERITDPARVPTASPMQNPVLYRLQGNQVILDGGEQAAITPVAAPTPAARQTYTVEAGDTCYSIAAAQGVPLEALIRANPAACDNLRIGASLTIPAPTPTPVTGGGLTADPTVRPTPTVPRSPGGTPGTGTVYIVRAGDTCSDIAASYGVSLAQLLAHNGFGPDCPLQIGQEVKIP